MNTHPPSAQEVVVWPDGVTSARDWRDLATLLAVPGLDWAALASGDGHDRGPLFNVMDCLLESSTVPELVSAVLRVCDCLIPATATGFDLLDPQTIQPLQAAGTWVSDSFMRLYEDGVRAHDLVLTTAVDSREARQCSDLFSATEWQSDSAYREAFGLLELAHVLYVPLVIEEYVIGTLNFGRIDAAGRYTEDEIGQSQQLAAVLTRIIARELSGIATAVSATADATPVPRTPPARGSAVSMLSEREVGIARLVSHGLHDREIADELGLSLHTVKQYLKQIYRRTALRSRVDLAVRMAVHDHAG